MFSHGRYQKSWRERKKELGLCVVCGADKAKQNCVTCQNCLSANTNQKKKWRKSGLCIFCGKEASGAQMCLQCNYMKRTLLFEFEDRQKAIQDLQKKNKQCQICGSKNHNGMNWNLDHDHKTNKYRGLLCQNCNTALGSFRDSVRILRKAIKYLQQ